MPSLQIAPSMTNPPPNGANKPPPNGRFISPYPNYFTLSDADSTTAIDQADPPIPMTASHLYPQAKAVDAGRNFISPEGLKEINDFVPLGTKVAWGEGATPSNEVDNSMALLSPTSQCVPLPMPMSLVPGISSFGPILNSWPMPPLPKRRRSSASEPVHEQQERKKRKASSTGQTMIETNRMSATTTAANPPRASPEKVNTLLTRSVTVMHNSPTGQPSMSSATPADAGIVSMNAHTQAHPQSQSPPPPPQPPPESSSTSESQLATQRARNRVAANKFRRKSKAAVAELETMERALAARHEQLSMMVQGLREEVLALKNELLMHGNCDCAMIHRYLSNTASRLSMGRGAADAGGHHRPSMGGGGNVSSLTPPGGVPFGN